MKKTYYLLKAFKKKSLMILKLNIDYLTPGDVLVFEDGKTKVQKLFKETYYIL